MSSLKYLIKKNREANGDRDDCLFWESLVDIVKAIVAIIVFCTYVSFWIALVYYISGEHNFWEIFFETFKKILFLKLKTL